MSEVKCECRISYGPGKNNPLIVKCKLCESAPELLEALKDLVRRFEASLMSSGTDKEFVHAPTMLARHAIAKAESR